MAQCLNDFFVNVGPKLSAEIPFEESTYAQPPHVHPNFELKEVSLKDTADFVSCGVDGLTS